MDLTVPFRKMSCRCGAIWAMPESVMRRKEGDHSCWYCPICAAVYHYPGESDVEKYRRLYQQERQCCIAAREDAERAEEEIERERRRFWGLKGHVAKVKKAINT